MYLGDSDLDNPKFTENLTKVKADLFESILGAIELIVTGILMNYKTL